MTPASVANPDRPAARFYHPELDGLRFFAFLAVFLHHAVTIRVAPTYKSELTRQIVTWLHAVQWTGTMGVDVFFVLSGYLITELLRRETVAFGSINLPLFYMRRSLRIWPLYFLFLAGAWCWEAAWLELPGLRGMELLLFCLFLGNWSSALYGFPVSTSSSLWTVSIEEQFYLFWPLMVWRFTVARIRTCAVVVLAVCTGVRIYAVLAGWSDLTVYVSTFTHLDGLACGALLSAVLNGRAPEISRDNRRLLCLAGVVAPILTYRWLGAGLDGESDWGLVLLYPILALSSLAIVVSTLAPSGQAAGWTAQGGIIWLGRISYGLYVYHRLALQLVSLGVKYGHVRLPIWGYAGASLLLTIAIASLSYYLIEQPILRWKDRFHRRQPQPVPPADAVSRPLLPESQPVGPGGSLQPSASA